jgi:hypothetical protein
LYVSSAEAEVTLSPSQLINGSFQPFFSNSLLIFVLLYFEAKWPILNAQWKRIIHFLRNIFSFIQGELAVLESIISPPVTLENSDGTI